ncbi:MAG: prolipoprotein diacylglyceryl transferase family protein [Spirochaetota bacterium]
MQSIYLLLTAITVMSCVIWYFSFTRFTHERYQVLFCFPTEKKENSWSGFCITWYGLIISLSFTFSFIIFVFLMGSSGISYLSVVIPVLISVAIGVLASKLLAERIEKTKATISVAAAMFTSFLLIPPSFFIYGKIFSETPIPVMIVLSSISIAFAFGEGYGRIACISFGCCYGKPVDKTGWFLRRIFHRMNFTFRGGLKKASYAGNLEGSPLVPIQGITSIVNVLTGITGIVLYYHGNFSSTLLTVIISLSAWRILSEQFRIDNRGSGKISAYQIMSLFNIGYSVFISVALYSANPLLPDFEKGINAVLSREIFPVSIVIFSILLIFYGKSKVIFPEIKLKVGNN